MEQISARERRHDEVKGAALEDLKVKVDVELGRDHDNVQRTRTLVCETHDVCPSTIGQRRIREDHMRTRQSRQNLSRHVRSCAEARQGLARLPRPHVIFTDSTLPDGTWADIVSLADQCPRPLQVVVVSPELDVDLYVKVLDGGAFDFIVPPFAGADLLHIVNCIAWKGLTQERPPASGRVAA